MAQHHVFDSHRHLTSFGMLFPDGRIKPTFLMASLGDFTDRDFKTHHLDQLGLRRDKDFTVVTTPELPTDVLGEYNRRGHGGRRTVLSLTGMLVAITKSGSTFGDDFMFWLYDEVVPQIVYGAPTPEDHPTLIETRDRFAQASDDMLNVAGQEGWRGELTRLTMADLVNTAIKVTENSR